MTLPRAATALLVVTLIAGCSQPGGVPHPSTEGPRDSGGLAAVNPPKASLRMTDLSISWDPTEYASVCAPSGVDSCMGAQLGDFLSKTFPLAGARNWTGTITLTWQSQNPTMSELELAGGPYAGCGTDCWSSQNGSAVRGTSPLTATFSFGDTGKDNDGFYVSISVPRATPSPIYAKAETFTQMHVRGNLTAAVPK
jgi:hypothetical protein